MPFLQKQLVGTPTSKSIKMQILNLSISNKCAKMKLACRNVTHDLYIYLGVLKNYVMSMGGGGKPLYQTCLTSWDMTRHALKPLNQRTLMTHSVCHANNFALMHSAYTLVQVYILYTETRLFFTCSLKGPLPLQAS